LSFAKRGQLQIVSILPKVGIAAFVVVIVFFGLKGCIVTVWSPPPEPTTYAIHGKDGRNLAMVFLPEHETIFLYAEEKTGFIEASLTEMRGSYGTHYFWRLWSVATPGLTSGPFTLRLYPAGSEPVVMETTVVRKFIQGTSKPNLPEEGKRTYPVILFSENALQFEGMLLAKEPTDARALQDLLRTLKPNKGD